MGDRETRIRVAWHMGSEQGPWESASWAERLCSHHRALSGWLFLESKMVWALLLPSQEDKNGPDGLL